MYNDLKKLKSIKGLTDAVKRKIEKAWTWGLISDEQFEELMEIQKESADATDVDGSDGVNEGTVDDADQSESVTE